MSIRIEKINQQKQEVILRVLYESAKKFDGDQTTEFINSLLTHSEKITIGRRILISQLILSGYNYNEINELFSLSPNTYAKTRRWLLKQIPNYDEALGEYEEIAKTRRAKRKQTKQRTYYDPLTFSGLRKKYPSHFLFFDTAETLLSKLNY